MGLEVAAVQIDTTGAAVTGDYVSMKGFGSLTAIIIQGAWAGGTPAVTLKQATDVGNSLSDEKAVTFTKKWSKVALTGTVWVQAAVTASTFNLTTVNNTVTAIEINAEDLDVDNGFDCARVGIATPGSNADLIAVMYILGDPRYPQLPAQDAKVD